MTPPTHHTHHGIHDLASPYSVTETLDRLSTLATAKGLTLFARIDFAKDAAAIGLTMPPTQLLLLGHPKSGTPLMLASPTAAIDLPLKALAWQDPNGQVWLSTNTPEYLLERHNLTLSFLPNIAPLHFLLEAAIKPD